MNIKIILTMVSLMFFVTNSFTQIVYNKEFNYLKIFQEKKITAPIKEGISNFFAEQRGINSRTSINKSALKNEGFLIKSTQLKWSDSIWVNNWFDTLSYDSQNNLSDKIKQIWADSIWENAWKYTYSYNVNNTLDEELVQRWSDSAWRNNWLYVHTYDTNNHNLIERLARLWNSSNSNWHDFSRELYQHDINNNLIEELHQNWDVYSSVWENTSLWMNTFNEKNNLTQRLYLVWNDSAWVNYWKYLYTHDTNNNVTEVVRQDWDDSSWVNFFRYSYFYDDNNNLSEAFLYAWDNLEWVVLLKAMFTYDANGNLVTELQQIWDNSIWVNFIQKNNEYISVTNIEQIESELASYSLSQNYPNPFNPSTTIRFAVTSPSFTTLKIYNSLGEEVAVLLDKELATGAYEVNWNASGLPSGVYYYTLNTEGIVETKKMILIK